MIALILLFVLFSVILVTWFNFLRDANRISAKGPLPLPVIGNAHMFLSGSAKIMDIFHELKLEYGDAYRVHFLSNPYVILSHPKYIEPLVTSAELISKGRSYNYLKPWLGLGLLTASGQRWKTHRKFLTSAFHFNILQNFLPIFCKNSWIYTKKLRDLADGTPVDLFPITALAALDNITESIMGVSVNAQTNSDSEYVKAIEQLAQIIALRIQVPIISPDFIFNLLPYKKKQDHALKVVHKQSRAVIEARKQELDKSNVTRLNKNEDIGIKNRNAFLDLLLLSEIDGEKIDDEKVREEVDTFMFEGHDTTASAVVYSLFCLSKHADVQEKMYEEQKSIFGDEMERDPTYAELHQMKYLDMVLKECMRLYPPVPLVERLMVKDAQLGELKVIAGTLIILNIMELHRNPDVFEDPLTFKPERFESTAGRNPFSWLAFSAGPRNCIGQRFAIMELKVVISAVIRTLRMSPADIEPQLCADLVLRSNNGVHVRFESRK
ncbi:hypothetical protein K1T71_004904 [Dendrolimus kikuchii]|uniref:Uncharacterized protein n=1 Tax=Dendrolimus kikuchii TaxID=765133 RepID=A0ACC1D5R6_9NEOP|nr:hypothetical protein K1T71_004904 [Dendrolimus kikuchii]